LSAETSTTAPAFEPRRRGSTLTASCVGDDLAVREAGAPPAAPRSRNCRVPPLQISEAIDHFWTVRNRFTTSKMDGPMGYFGVETREKQIF
jgi:hypothetical protein